jgi:hypothetical protein
MQLHIVVPGLLWPKDSLNEITRGLGQRGLPALATLLGRGCLERHPPLPLEHWLGKAFGIHTEETPFGALRLLGDGLDPGADAWLCADPVHLRFSRDTLVVGGATELDLAQHEATQLVAELNAHLAEFGEFIAPHPRRWYLRLKRPPHLSTHTLSTVTGRTIEPFLPQGDDARAWRRFINEAQVLLHNHPLNTAREAAGRPTANSLWLWGAGALPSGAVAPVAHVHANHPLALGLAKLAGIAATPAPARANDAVPQSLTFLEDLGEAAQTLDAMTWRAGLAELEANWFAPLLVALKLRRLQQLRLTALGDAATIDVTINAGDLRKFWRRPQSLSDILQ